MCANLEQIIVGAFAQAFVHDVQVLGGRHHYRTRRVSSEKRHRREEGRERESGRVLTMGESSMWAFLRTAFTTPMPGTARNTTFEDQWSMQWVCASGGGARTIDIRHVKIAEHKVEGPVLDELDGLAATLDHLHLCAADRWSERERARARAWL